MTPQELIRRHPLLATLDENESRELLRHAHTKPYAAGKTVFLEGDPGDGLYGVLSGRIVVTVESVAGKELILNTFGPGEFFGEIALLDGKGRTATAMAREPSVLLFIARSVFLPFIERRPAIAVRMIAFLCERLRRTTHLVEDSTFLNVPTRLAKQVSGLAHEYGRRDGADGGITVRVSQDELARMLGVSREIVSRQLGVWREAGVLDIRRGQLILHAADALDRITAGG